MAQSTESAINRLKDLIKAVPDFPKPGILFRDIMPIFKDPDAVTSLIDLMVAFIEVSYPDVEVIAGLDARGFLIGPLVAHECSKSFVPVRKGGKLPGKTISMKSTKEYGEDVLEIQADAVKPGDKVVIIDDLLATGGTMATSCELFKAAQSNLLGCLCLIELEDLKVFRLQCLSLHVSSVLKKAAVTESMFCLQCFFLFGFEEDLSLAATIKSMTA